MSAMQCGCFRLSRGKRRLTIFIQQALRDVVKHGGVDVIKNFEDKFKELRVEGCRKEGGSSSAVSYTEDREEMDEEDLPDKDEYNDKMATILSDSETYELLKSNPLKDHNKYVRKVIRDTA